MAKSNNAAEEAVLTLLPRGSVYEELEEEQLERYVNFKKSLDDQYSGSADKQRDWNLKADEMIFGTLLKDEGIKLDDEKTKDSKTQITEKSESPIMKLILSHKVSQILSIPATPTLVTLDGERNTKLQSAITFLNDSLLRPNIKCRIFTDKEKYGLGIVKLKLKHVADGNMKNDIDAVAIKPGDLVWDFKVPIQKTDRLFFRQTITMDELEVINNVFSIRYIEGAKLSIEEAASIQGESISEEEILEQLASNYDELEYCELYMLAKDGPDERERLCKKIIMVDDQVVDVIDTGFSVLPFVDYREEAILDNYKQSITYASLDAYKNYTKAETGISRMIAYITHPQYELAIDNIEGNMKNLGLALQYPGSIIPVTVPNSINKIDRGDQISALMAIQESYKAKLFEINGLNKTNLGESSGSLTTSTGVIALLGAAEGPVKTLVPGIIGFQTDFSKTVLNVITDSFTEFKYFMEDKESKQMISTLSADDLKTRSNIDIFLSSTNEEANSQMALQHISQMVQFVIQYDQDGSSGLKELIPTLFNVYSDLLPLDSAHKNRINSASDGVIKNAFKKSKAEGIEQGVDATTQAIQSQMGQMGQPQPQQPM